MSEAGRRIGDIEQGKKIKKERENKEMTQKDLAARVRVTEVYICLLEKGERRASLEVLKRICDVLGVALSYMLGDTTSKVPKECITPTMVGELVTDTIENMQNTIDALRAELEFYRPKERPDE